MQFHNFSLIKNYIKKAKKYEFTKGYETGLSPEVLIGQSRKAVPSLWTVTLCGASRNSGTCSPVLKIQIISRLFSFETIVAKIRFIKSYLF